MKREINKLMRANDFVLIRSKKHNIWEKEGYGLRMSTSSFHQIEMLCTQLKET